MADNQPVVEVTEDIEEIEVGDGADPTYQLDPGAYCTVTTASSVYVGLPAKFEPAHEISCVGIFSLTRLR